MSNILVPPFFGSVLFWSALIQEEQAKIFQNISFVKSSRLNRTEIATANGISILTIPIKGGRNSKQLLTDIKIDYDTFWQKNHLHALQSAYGKSAYWEYYKEMILKIYESHFTFLLELNMFCLHEIASKLKLSSSFEIQPQQVNLKDSESFLFRKKTPLPPYFQNFSHKYAFESDLSILDLILNTGPKASLYLQQINSLEQ